MEYTQSPDFATHGGTGQRMHTDTAPIPTAVTANDENMVIWSLMEVVKAAGLTGIAFDPNSPASYQRLRDALNLLFITPTELATYAPSATTTLQGLVELATSPEGIAEASFTLAVSPGVLGAVLSARTASDAQTIAGLLNNVFVTPASLAARLANLVVGVPIGTPMYWPGTTPPAGFIKRNGGLLPRADWPLLWAMAQASGNIVNEAAWPARPGSFSTGDGATTFRIPMGLGLIERGYHDGNGTYDADTSHALGTYRDSRNRLHSHSVWGDNSGSGASGQVASLNGGSYPIAGSARSGGYLTNGGAGAQLIGDEGGADGYPRHALYLPIIRSHN